MIEELYLICLAQFNLAECERQICANKIMEKIRYLYMKSRVSIETDYMPSLTIQKTKKTWHCYPSSIAVPMLRLLDRLGLKKHKKLFGL